MDSSPHSSPSPSQDKAAAAKQAAAAAGEAARNVKIETGLRDQENPENAAPIFAEDGLSHQERAPRAFLKSSFGQRLSAQCGSIFLDTTISSTGKKVEGLDAEPRSKLGTGSGRDSSGLSEADAKSMAVVASEPGFGIANANSGSQFVKLWGISPATLQKSRASIPNTHGRDGSPIGQAQRSMFGTEGFSKTAAAEDLKKSNKASEEPKQEKGVANSDLEEARKEMIADVSARTSHSLEQGTKAEDIVLTRDTSLPRDLQPLSESDAVTGNLSEIGAGSGNTRRGSFKSDCGFLKLLPSKRKFSSEEHEPVKVSGTFLVPSDRHTSGEVGQAVRLSSNSSGIGGNVISKRSLLLHLKSTAANDLGIKEFSQGAMQVDNSSREWSNGNRRRGGGGGAGGGGALADGKPAVGSFMKWMIDVGKGLAKKRCFGVVPAPPVQSVEISPASSPITGICIDHGRSKASSNVNVASRMCDSSKPSEDGRTGHSPQSCQNMETEEPVSSNPRAATVLDSSPKEATDGKNSSVPEEACDMHTSGDEQQRHVQETTRIGNEHEEEHDEKLEFENEEQCSPETMDKTEEEIEVQNSQNATQGTNSRSQATQRQKVSGSPKDSSNKVRREQEEVVSDVRSRKASPPKKNANESGEEEASLDVWTSSHAAAPKQVTAAESKPLASSATFGAFLRSSALPVSGEMMSECSQGMAEFVASMASVKNWIIQNRVSISNLNKKPSFTSSNKSSSTNKRCNFCGLNGHTVIDCSETLDCELKDMERRSAVLDEMGTELRDLPCLRCLGMGHLGAQCRFSVTEAASRARENSELRSWNFARKMANKTSAAVDNAHHQSSDHQASVLWTQNNNIGQSKQDKVVVSKQRTSPSDKNPTPKPRKQEVSPKENVYKKIGLPSKEKDANTGSKRRSSQSASDLSLPPLPKTMLVSIEAVRLSRSELWKWVDSPDFSTHVRGFFLRLRFGRWEKDLGGTGYRMARIRGAIRKNATDEKNMSVSVDLGDLECTVDSQYVSNHPFTEAELVEWWRGRWKAGKRIISEAELQVKAAQRKSFQ